MADSHGRNRSPAQALPRPTGPTRGTGTLAGAVLRGVLQRHAILRQPQLPLALSVLVYAGLLFVGSLFLLLVWQYPDGPSFVLVQVLALGSRITQVNALWFALLAVEVLGDSGPARRRLPILLAGLILIGLAQVLTLHMAAAAQG